MARGRPSKLTEAQWHDVERRHVKGESIRALARELKVSESSIRERISARARETKAVAHQIVATEQRLAALPISAQLTAQDLASKLRSIQDNLTHAGVHGAATAHRLMALTNQEVQKIDDADPLANTEALRGVAILSATANQAARIPLALMSAAARAAGANPSDDTELDDPDPSV